MARFAGLTVTSALLLAVLAGRAAAARPLSCSVIPRGAIATALSTPLLSGRSTRDGAKGTFCEYFGRTQRPAVVIDYEVGVTESSAQFQARATGDGRPVPGVADSAYTFAGPFEGEKSLTVLDGRTIFEIEAYTSLKRLEALATKIAPLART